MAAVAVGYPLLAYCAARTPAAHALSAGLAFVPLLLLAAWLIRNAPRRAALLLLAVLGGLWAWRSHDFLLAHYDWAYLLQHAGTLALLAVIFGRTLRPGEMPMIARFAQMVHGSLSPQVAHYTRGATWAWCAFFVAMAASSLALFAVAPFSAWSLFANLLTGPLVALMFGAEYLVRLRVLPAHDRAGLLQAFTAYLRYSAAARPGNGPRAD